ncbi:MAG: Protein-export membrane protein SecF [Microgenomates bacterium OLB23]|nr:MAG: Protein-export membrane protein SecF [Microgenomates bacterium OLB23]
MEFFLKTIMIDFIRYTKLYFALSIVVISAGLFTLVSQGLNLSIDFTGGSMLEYSFDKNISSNDINKVFEKNNVAVSQITPQNEQRFIIRAATMSETQERAVRDELKATQLRFDSVGPLLGSETMQKTLFASVVAVLGILLYISFTFQKLSYGVAAIVALLHDVLVLFGIYALLARFGAEVDTLFITAVLTTMSFSVHDTIVMFDKIREYKRTSGFGIEVLANKALTETIVRSVNNSLTIVLMLVPLALFGGDAVRFFAAALLIGTITGTYSSPCIATPLLVLLEKRRSTR